MPITVLVNTFASQILFAPPVPFTNRKGRGQGSGCRCWCSNAIVHLETLQWNGCGSNRMEAVGVDIGPRDLARCDGAVVRLLGRHGPG